MSNLQLIKSDKFGEVERNINKIDELVHQAIINSYRDLDVALEYVNKAFSGLNCPWIETCVRETVMKWFMDSRPNEQSVYSWFRRVHKEKVGTEWKIVKLKNDSKHIPDFWLSNGIENIPVECKLHEVDAKALGQLKRYMDFYNCKKGITVGNKLTVDLPDNILFIGFEYTELVDGE